MALSGKVSYHFDHLVLPPSAGDWLLFSFVHLNFVFKVLRALDGINKNIISSCL